MPRADFAQAAGEARVKPDAIAHAGAAIKAVLREAIKAGGSSLRDHKRADGELGYFQHISPSTTARASPVRPRRKGQAAADDQAHRAGGTLDLLLPECQK